MKNFVSRIEIVLVYFSAACCSSGYGRSTSTILSRLGYRCYVKTFPLSFFFIKFVNSSGEIVSTPNIREKLQEYKQTSKTFETNATRT